MFVYYSTKLVFEDPPNAQWTLAAIVMLVVVFLAFAVYDPLMKAIPKPPIQAAVGWVLTVLVLLALRHWAGFSYRGTAIHMGATSSERSDLTAYRLIAKSWASGAGMPWTPVLAGRRSMPACRKNSRRASLSAS